MADTAAAPARCESVDPIRVRLHAIQQAVEQADGALRALRETRWELVIQAKDAGLSISTIAAATQLSHAGIHRIMANPPR